MVRLYFREYTMTTDGWLNVVEVRMARGVLCLAYPLFQLIKHYLEPLIPSGVSPCMVKPSDLLTRERQKVHSHDAWLQVVKPIIMVQLYFREYTKTTNGWLNVFEVSCEIEFQVLIGVRSKKINHHSSFQLAKPGTMSAIYLVADYGSFEYAPTSAASDGCSVVERSAVAFVRSYLRLQH
ncbi:hypothetical protein HPB52_017916 [Rhipicephalus sanguineus]|uniref:Uncharacterized protein n=1 Tax=Rhipicephalus sanguineus TaxID=34632 RepID=A0A9D4SWI6_RHISA|nr:hypothetical protein HPB52_017916 [Rhipicephalus sanguineus]